MHISPHYEQAVPMRACSDPSAVARGLRLWRPMFRPAPHTSTDSHIPGIRDQTPPPAHSIANCIAPRSMDRFRRHTIRTRSLSRHEDEALPQHGAARSPIPTKLRAVAAGFRVVVDVQAASIECSIASDIVRMTIGFGPRCSPTFRIQILQLVPSRGARGP